MTEAESDARDLYIHARIEEMVYWAGERRGISRASFLNSVIRYMRGFPTQDAQTISNALTAILEDQKINPPVTDLLDRVESFKESEEAEAYDNALVRALAVEADA